MGLISLAIIMFEAGKEKIASKEEDFILAIDFAHITLFFLTIFFVCHTLFLIKASISVARSYRKYYALSSAVLLKSIVVGRETIMWKVTPLLKYMPFFRLRDHVEFSIIHSIFDASYLLPDKFNFPAYLSSCFARFSLKLINRSIYSWLAIIIAIVVNIGRVGIGESCSIKEAASAGHRFLAEKGSSADDHSIAEYDNKDCETANVSFFLFCGGLLCGYVTILVVVCRIYRTR